MDHLSFDSQEFKNAITDWENAAKYMRDAGDLVLQLDLAKSPRWRFGDYIDKYQQAFKLVAKLTGEAQTELAEISLALIETSKTYTNVELGNKERLEEIIRIIKNT